MTKEMLSCNQKDTLMTYHNGVENPIASLQVIHGMKEHMGRYEALFSFFKERDILVFGHDHLGHGPLGLKGYTHLEKDAFLSLIEDVSVVSQAYRGKEPHVKLGHSMGSFVLRGYLGKHSEDSFKGAILMGSAMEDTKLLSAGLLLANTLGKLKGEEAQSKILYSMSDGRYYKTLKNPETKLDWLSLNKENVKAYEEDPLSGHPFSIGAYRELYKLLLYVLSPKEMEKMNKNLPLLLMSGRRDPVGDMGRGIRKLETFLKNLGQEEVEVKLYPYMRHEILKEEGSREILEDILLFINRSTK